jgi:hypothetical protein
MNYVHELWNESTEAFLKLIVNEDHANTNSTLRCTNTVLPRQTILWDMVSQKMNRTLIISLVELEKMLSSKK